MRKYNKFGTITPAILVLTGAFMVVIYALLLLLSLQLDFSNRRVFRENSLQIAEAGVEYYKWHLIADQTDFQDGTGVPGPYLHEYFDNSGESVGFFSLDITPPEDGVTPIIVRSTGWTNKQPSIRRSIKATFGQQPLTAFAFLHNSNIWFGQEVTINGPIFTNGGIRMDGTNTSTVRTSRATYTCGIETGCTTPTEKPGIWGNGGPQELWEFPYVNVDFDSIDIDFNALKIAAQANGLYLGPSSGRGYRLEFQSDGSVNVYEVNVAQSFKGYSLEDGCENLFQDIKNESYLASYNISSLNVIYVEDDIWVGGVVEGKVTVAAGRFPIDTNNANIWITENIVYAQKDGTDSIGLIAQKDIIFGRDVPDYFEVNGGLLAQKGRVIRHHYNWFQCSHGPAGQKNELTIYGSVISDLRSYWNFSQGPQSPAAGFVKTTITYDPELEAEPPSYFPSTGSLRLLKWEEE